MKRVIATFLLVSIFLPAALQAETQVYYYENGLGDASFAEHYADTDVVSPQTYYVGWDLEIHKTDDHGVIDQAQKKGVKVVPLIHQQDFNRLLMTVILAILEVQDNVIEELIDEAKDEEYAGWQFDFENIASTDRDRYSSFVERASEAFRKNGLELSVAVIPRTTPYDPNATYQDLSSAYDYTRLANTTDYLVAMAYNDPHSFGPTGSLPYQRAVVSFMTSLIPASKLQLGVPLYCSKWRITGGYKKFGELPHSDTQEDLDVSTLLKKGYSDAVASEYYLYVVPSGNIYLTWCDGVEGFTAKQQLAKSYNLRGISLWALGQEDDGIWERL